MSHLLQPVIELVLIAFFLGYSDGPNNSFNDWFIFNTELMQPCGKTVLGVGSVYSKAICFFTRRGQEDLDYAPLWVLLVDFFLEFDLFL